ncbi:superoxide dismutase family protein, partial [Gluconobacter cerinus]|nr:superoxide dismutase family protein [Gluconobacter cerinus]
MKETVFNTHYILRSFNNLQKRRDFYYSNNNSLIDFITYVNKILYLLAGGGALVVHASADDYQSQPIGGSGLRVICGVVR